MAGAIKLRRRIVTALFAAGLCGIQGARAASPSRSNATSSVDDLAERLAQTERDHILDVLVPAIRNGLDAAALTDSLLVAGSRHIAPRPHVGYQYHAVLALRSVSSAAAVLPGPERWLPLLWASDYFKRAQERAARESDSEWPEFGTASQSPDLESALDGWDLEAADGAVAAALKAPAFAPDFDALCAYSLRDFHDIGHKTIAVANVQWAWPRLDAVSRLPVLRSLVQALLNRHGEAPQALAESSLGRAWRWSMDWAADPARRARSDAVTIPAVLARLRTTDGEAAARAITSILTAGADPATIRQALLLAAAEILLQSRNFVALHAVTSAEALVQCLARVRDGRLQRVLLTQGAALIAAFRRAARVDDDPDWHIDALRPQALGASSDTLTAVFDGMAPDRRRAAAALLAVLRSGTAADTVISAARRYCVFKTGEIHDYKFTEAVIAGYHLLESPWRERWLAAGALWFNTPADPDNSFVISARAALAG